MQTTIFAVFFKDWDDYCR